MVINYEVVRTDCACGEFEADFGICISFNLPIYGIKPLTDKLIWMKGNGGEDKGIYRELMVVMFHPVVIGRR